MRSCLIVANQTLSSPTLAEVVAERLSQEPTHFHVVVPATPIQHLLSWEEGEAYEAARQRLDAVLTRLRDLGAEASGEVGSRDPVAAVQDALRRQRADEVILSTLPPGISRWLGRDVPGRLRGSVTVPVTIVTAPRDTSVATQR